MKYQCTQDKAPLLFFHCFLRRNIQYYETLSYSMFHEFFPTTGFASVLFDFGFFPTQLLFSFLLFSFSFFSANYDSSLLPSHFLSQTEREFKLQLVADVKPARACSKGILCYRVHPEVKEVGCRTRQSRKPTQALPCHHHPTWLGAGRDRRGGGMLLCSRACKDSG